MKIIKSTLLLLAFFQFMHIPSRAQSQKEADFKKTSDGLLEAIIKKSYKEINKYINPTYGVYVMYFESAQYDSWNVVKKLNDDYSPNIGNMSLADMKKYPLTYGKLPAFDCKKGWNKKGYFADSVGKYKPISSTHNPGKGYARALKFVEQNSRKLIFTGNKGGWFIFYMSYINNKWWFSMIDWWTGNCPGDN